MYVDVLFTGAEIAGEQRQEFTGDVIGDSDCHFAAVRRAVARPSA